jgi:hypothetical protein
VGKVIDVQFRASDRGRWCVRCDEPFPEGTALCPRCGGDLVSAARHRSEMIAGARKRVRRWVATGLGLFVAIVAALVWLLFGPGVAHGQEPAAAAKKAPRVEKKSDKPAATKTAHPPDGGVAVDPGVESTLTPRPVRVRLLDGSTVVGTVHAEEAATLVVDCSLGQLAIPRSRISTIAYDAAAGVGQKRAPVQQLDDEDRPTNKQRATQP